MKNRLNRTELKDVCESIIRGLTTYFALLIMPTLIVYMDNSLSFFVGFLYEVFGVALLSVEELIRYNNSVSRNRVFRIGDAFVQGTFNLMRNIQLIYYHFTRRITRKDISIKYETRVISLESKDVQEQLELLKSDVKRLQQTSRFRLLGYGFLLIGFIFSFIALITNVN